MSSLEIRRACQEDIPAFVQIERAVFSAPWSEDSFLHAIESEDNRYFTAVWEGAVVGYCGFWVSFETADLCNLAVASDYRRRAVGKRLLAEGIQRLQRDGVESILLEVRQSNEAARCLYQKMKFYEIGTRKNYYSLPREDAVLMKRDLR